MFVCSDHFLYLWKAQSVVTCVIRLTQTGFPPRNLGHDETSCLLQMLQLHCKVQLKEVTFCNISLSSNPSSLSPCFSLTFPINFCHSYPHSYLSWSPVEPGMYKGYARLVQKGRLKHKCEGIIYVWRHSKTRIHYYIITLQVMEKENEK